MLEVKGLTKRYNSIAAVDDVSFRIDSGKVYGYLGPNGSGKTTTVKMLTGLLEPTRGHIFYRGRDIREDLVAYTMSRSRAWTSRQYLFLGASFVLWHGKAKSSCLVRTFWK
jgi:ABC-type multidrug transport system ATPase subunit